MKTKNIYAIIAYLLLINSCFVKSQGFILPNGVVVDYNGYFFPNEIDVRYDPGNTDAYTGFNFDQEGKTPPTYPYNNTFFFDPVVDVGVRVFFVTPGDVIDEQSILGGQFTEMTPQNYVFNAVPFYVALYTGYPATAPPNGIYSDPLFGWAELKNVNGIVELISGEIEAQGGGIIAGTQTVLPVPEPSTIGLVLLGAGGLFFSRQKMRSKKPIAE